MVGAAIFLPPPWPPWSSPSPADGLAPWSFAALLKAAAFLAVYLLPSLITQSTFFFPTLTESYGQCRQTLPHSGRVAYARAWWNIEFCPPNVNDSEEKKGRESPCSSTYL